MMLREIENEYREVKSLFRWFLKYRKAEVPIQFRDNNTYLNWHFQHRPKLKNFENLHQGEDCFIVGNGPSLNKINLELLNKYYVFGLNKIHLIFEKQQLQLDYHVCVNNLVIKQIESALNDNIFDCPSFISYNSSKKTSYTNTNVYKILTNAPWSFCKTIMQPISEGFTVTYVAMQLAYFMGFRNVFLVGIDHNFQQIGKPNEEQILQGKDNNHFHPEYFKGQQWHLADLEGNEASYALAKHQFHADGREIYDATVGGKLNIYRKLRFEEALKIAKPKPTEKKTGLNI